MSTFGRTVIGNVGTSIQLCADGKPDMKQAGVTLDWATVAAVSGADVVTEDTFTVLIGEKYLRYGQVITKITTGGKYGPYDPAASDGRQTLTKGSCFVLNWSVKENDLHSDHPAAMYGGLIFKDRLLATAGTHSLAAGPTYTELEAVLPRLAYVAESPN